jgi:hypothetical protein
MDFTDKVLADLVGKIKALEAQIEARIAEHRAQFHYTVEKNRIRFEQGVLAGHRALRRGLWRQIRESPWQFMLVSPVIYSLVVPIAFLDLALAVYQAQCFRVYGIPRVKRSDHVVIDRHQLAYLNPLEKLNCVYCGYANGVLGLAREVAARTEEYWCPIKHARPIPGPHSRYVEFVDYGNAEDYRRRQKDLRRRACESDCEQCGPKDGEVKP